MQTTNGGFTLAEAMVAMAIFSIIGLGCWQVSSQLLDAKTRVEERSARLREVQKGIWIISRDLQHIIDRPARDPSGLREPAITSMVPGQILTFTRNGWANPLDDRRSHLQRVAYRLDRDERGSLLLIRRFWTTPDRNRDTTQHEQILIRDVSYLDVQFIDNEGQIHFHWPLHSVQRPDRPNATLPGGIRLRLGAPPYGNIEKVYGLSHGVFQP